MERHPGQRSTGRRTIAKLATVCALVAGPTIPASVVASADSPQGRLVVKGGFNTTLLLGMSTCNSVRYGSPAHQIQYFEAAFSSTSLWVPIWRFFFLSPVNTDTDYATTDTVAVFDTDATFWGSFDRSPHGGLPLSEAHISSDSQSGQITMRLPSLYNSQRRAPITISVSWYKGQCTPRLPTATVVWPFTSSDTRAAIKAVERRLPATALADYPQASVVGDMYGQGASALHAYQRALELEGVPGAKLFVKLATTAGDLHLTGLSHQYWEDAYRAVDFTLLAPPEQQLIKEHLK